MNKNHKKTIVGAFVLLMAVFMLSGSAMAKPSKKTVKKAYRAYMQRYKSEVMYGDARYCIKDLNKDGVAECIIQYQYGMKCKIILLGYRNKKVVEILQDTGMEEIHYNKKKNRICIDYSSGAASHTANIYKLSGTKLKLVDYYQSDFLGSRITYVHKKKTITESKFYASLRKIWNTWTDVSPFSKGTVF